jgi:hypothetical protein
MFSVWVALLAAFSVLFLLFLSRLRSEPAGLAFLGSPTSSATSLALVVTNTSGRDIAYTVLRPQAKCDGVWTEGLSGWGFETGYVTPLQKLAPPTLAPRQASTLFVPAPRHITAAPGTTAWRIAVVWGYSSPSKWDKFQNMLIGRLLFWGYSSPSKLYQLKAKADMIFTGRRPGARSVVFTNFSSEITL